jgi:hypothetical protein
MSDELDSLFHLDLDRIERDLRLIRDPVQRRILQRARIHILSCAKELQSAGSAGRRLHLRAEECRAFADCSKTGSTQATYEQLAQMYDRLARQADGVMMKRKDGH